MPIGVSNCTRVLRYSSVVSNSCSAIPNSSAARQVRPRSSTVSSAAQPSPRVPSSASLPNCTWSSCRRALLRESISDKALTVKPGVPAGTRNRLMPCVSPGCPEVRAATTKASAPSPSTTQNLSPCKR
ncbi:hypothetical protein D3C84_805530 [compost metagenome]